MTPDAPNDRDVTRCTIVNRADVAEIEARQPLEHVAGHTIYRALQHSAGAFPDRAAIRQLERPDDVDPQTISFREYLARSEQAANLFHAVTGGERPIVAIVAPFMPEAFIAAWAAAIGGIYVPINPYLESGHVAGILRAANANVLITATDAVGPGAWTRLPELIAAAPGLRAVFKIGGEGSDDFTRAAAAYKGLPLQFAPVEDPWSDCAYLHTGGTTATPKLVRHSHAGQLIQGWLCGTAMGSEADGVVAHAMPNFHVGGAIAVGMRGIVFGQTVVTLTTSGFRNPGVVAQFWDIVDRFGVTNITTAPTTAAAILDAGGEGPGTLRQFTTGGGPLSPALARAFHARYGVHAREVWGGTEFHGILSFHYGGDVPPRLGSCGRAVPFHDVIPAVLEENRFVRRAAPDERGILIAHGPTTITGYVDPANDAQFFVQDGPDGHRWASTGDVGTVDEDGFIWIFGREKDVIIRGGHNIDSASIDDVLASHPAVLHAAAVGRPCAAKGELPIAYVQLRPGATATPDDILTYARVHMQERAAIPVEIVLLDAIPMTAVGKVSKPPLRLDAIRRVAEATLTSCGCHGEVVVEERGGRSIVRVPALDETNTATLEAAFSGFTFVTEFQR